MTKASEDIQSSAHVWGEGMIDDPNNRQSQPAASQQNLAPIPADAPPSYTPTSTSSLPTENNSSSQFQRQPSPSRPRLNPIQALSCLSNVAFHSYKIPNATLTPNRSITTSTYAPFYSSVASLTKLISDQASLPPRALIRITGTHTDNSGRSMPDFDIILNLTTLLDLSTSTDSEASSHLAFKELPIDAESSRSPSGGSRLFKRDKRPPSDNSPLHKWVTKYVNDKSENKSFSLARVIPHFIPFQQSLEGNIRTLLHTLQYRGKVEVTCPMQYACVIVSKTPTNWFANMLNFHPEKKYDVLESTWHFRGHPSTSSPGADPITRSEQSFKAAEINARSLAEGTGVIGGIL